MNPSFYPRMRAYFYGYLFDYFLHALLESELEFQPDSKLDSMPDSSLASDFSKNADIANKFRDEGNNFFENFQFYEALECFNKSLCSAVHGSNAIALAYANRSAIYLEVKEYQLCLENIQLARQAGYPKNQIEELNNREARCLKKMESRVEVNVLDSKDFIKLSYPANEKLPFIVNCLDLRENHKFGRHIITNQELKAGDIIAIETPFAKSVSISSRHMRCINCLKSNKMSLIPCGKSSQAMFCSLQCKDEATRVFLNAERKSKIDDVIQRVFWEALDICGRDFAKLQQLVDDPELSQKTIFDFDFSDENDPLYKYHKLLAFNGLFQGNYLPDMDYINNHPCLKQLGNDREKKTAKAFMLRVFKILTMNSFGVASLSRDRQGGNIASVILLFGGLLNISCVPNVNVFNMDDKMVFSVRQRIKKGEQLFFTFESRFFDTPRDERQYFLEQRYGFVCSCEACSKNIPHQISEYQVPYYEDIITKGTKPRKLIKQFKKNCAILSKETEKCPELKINKIMDQNVILLSAIAKCEPYIF